MAHSQDVPRNPDHRHDRDHQAENDTPIDDQDQDHTVTNVEEVIGQDQGVMTEVTSATTIDGAGEIIIAEVITTSEVAVDHRCHTADAILGTGKTRQLVVA